MKNITLVTLNMNQNMKDITQSVNEAIASSSDQTDLSISVSKVFSSYITQTGINLILLNQGKILRD